MWEILPKLFVSMHNLFVKAIQKNEHRNTEDVPIPNYFQNNSRKASILCQFSCSFFFLFYSNKFWFLLIPVLPPSCTDIASGSSIDWAYGKQNISLSFIFELRDTGKSLKECSRCLIQSNLTPLNQLASFRKKRILATSWSNRSKFRRSHRSTESNDQRSCST